MSQTVTMVQDGAAAISTSASFASSNYAKISQLIWQWYMDVWKL